jgi:membrane-associated phospholipid phosphatase
VNRFSARREVALVLAVYALYLFVRKLVLAGQGRDRARRNAERIVAVEDALGLHVEPAVQRALLRFPRVVYGLNVGYALFNLSFTAGWLVLLFRRRDPDYHRLRNACLLAHVAAEPAFLIFPTAPPRVLEGFVDTLSELGGVDIEHPFLLHFYNPVAAMPSLHVTFAALTGGAIAERSESRLVKAAGYGYAPLVALVVTGTGNHYVLDSVAGAALGAVTRGIA